MQPKYLHRPDTITETYTQSSLTTFCECPEKYRLSQLEGGFGIKPRDTHYRMEAGTILQRAVSGMHLYAYPEKHFENNIRRDYADYIKTLTNPSPQLLQEIEVSTECTVGAMYGYHKRWLSKPMKFKVVQSSVPVLFYIHIHGHKYQFRGEIDMIGSKGGRTVLVEMKHTADISQNFKFDVEMSPQTLLYLIGYYEMLDITTDILTLFDYVRKPSIRPRKGESLRQYMQRVRDDYQARPDFYFHRTYIRRSPADILRFKQELIAMVRSLQFIQRRNLWYRNRKACLARGRCQFFDICAFGKTPGIMANFVQKTQQHEELAKHDTPKEEK